MTKKLIIKQVELPKCPLCGADMSEAVNENGYKIYRCNNWDTTGCGGIFPHIDELKFKYEQESAWFDNECIPGIEIKTVDVKEPNQDNE